MPDEFTGGGLPRTNNCTVDRVRARAERMTPVRRAEIYRPGQERDAPLKDWPKIWTPRERARAIVRSVAEAHGFSLEEMYGPRGPNALVQAMHEAMYRLRAETPMSLPQIARHMGHKDHTSIIYGIRQHCKRNGLEAPR